MRTKTYEAIISDMPVGIKRNVLAIISKCEGRGNRITKKEIANLLHLKYTSGVDRQIRATVNELRHDGILILSDSGGAGFWIAATRDEVDDVLAELEARAKDILEQTRILRMAANNELSAQMGLGI